VWAAFEAGGWNLAAPIPKARCQEVAAQFGTTLGAIRNYLADLRREKEIPLGRPGRCKPEANERRCAWGNRRRDQIREALVHRGLLLTTLLSDATKEEIARETGMSLHSCRQYVSQLRKEAGISRPRSLSPNRFPTPKQERTMDTEENGTDALQLASTGTNGPIPQVFQPHGSFAAQAEPPSALGEALSDLVRVALEHGWRSIEPEAFREPIRKLLETITGPKEEASR